MIVFEEAGTAKDLKDLKVWAEVMNNHIDVVKEDVKVVGFFYVSLYYGKAGDEPKIRAVFIWDAKTKKIWFIEDNKGDITYGSPEADKLIRYSRKQWKRLYEMRTGRPW